VDCRDEEENKLGLVHIAFATYTFCYWRGSEGRESSQVEIVFNDGEYNGRKFTGRILASTNSDIIEQHGRA
jgi:hypothetical protein